MNTLKKIIWATLASCALLAGGAMAQTQEAPDALIKRISEDVMATAKSDKAIKNGDAHRVQQIVEEKILPYVDFQRTTMLATGRYWRDATDEQKKRLTEEFRSLLIYTYAGAIAQIKDQQLEYKPLRADPSDTDVIVNTQVIQPRGTPIQLSYRLEKKDSGWKIYDVNVLGAWLVQAYKGSFASEIGKSGIDGLIKTLAEKNKKLAASFAQKVKDAS
jgi:phospholipid transport system substrate-binding protein